MAGNKRGQLGSGGAKTEWLYSKGSGLQFAHFVRGYKKSEDKSFRAGNFIDL
jgi:hypothetical protein